jgi:hypothetical protein
VILDPIRDTTDRLSWGWVACLYGLFIGRWVGPGEASEITGQSPATLQTWAKEGVISQLIGGKEHEHRYLATELQLIGGIFPECLTVTLTMLQEHIEYVMGGET